MLTIDKIQPFKIMVGPDRGQAIRGQLAHNDSSRLSPEFEPLEVYGFDGTVVFPAVFNAWGKRIVKNGNKVSDASDVSDKDYKGEIQPMAWGDENGYQIMCRFVKGHQTLDYLYQVNRLNIHKHNAPEAKDTNYISLPMGEHDVDVKDKAYALMLMIHPLNKDSICRSESIEHFQWSQVKKLDIDSAKAKEATKEYDSVGVIKAAASSFKKLSILYSILNENIEYDKKDETTMYEAMVLFAKVNPDKVKSAVTKFYEDVEGTLAKAQAFNALNTEEKGVLKLKVGETWQPMITDSPASSSTMVKWFAENIMEPAIFDAYGKIKAAADKDFKI